MISPAPFPAVACHAFDFAAIGREDLHWVQRRLMY
jgi:hypothetical protein